MQMEIKITRSPLCVKEVMYDSLHEALIKVVQSRLAVHCQDIKNFVQDLPPLVYVCARGSAASFKDELCFYIHDLILCFCTLQLKLFYIYAC